MPFKAKDKDKNCIVVAFNYKNGAEIRAKHPNLICPHCGAKMSARGSLISGTKTHFYHVPSDKPCPLNEKYRNISDKIHHTLAVEATLNYLKNHLSAYLKEYNWHLDIEIRVGNRIADIAMLNSDNIPVEVFEVQLTKIPTSELQQRTEDYLKEGVEINWFFGKGCDTEEIKQWSLRSNGCYFNCFQVKDEYEDEF